MNRLTSKGRTLRGIMETSVALSGSRHEAADFKATVAVGSHPMKRVVARTLVSAAVAAPAITARLIGRPLPRGMTYAGAGWHSVAYRAGNEVIKVNKRSVYMTEDERRELAKSEESRHNVLKTYLGTVTVPQTVEIGSHPAIPQQRAVQIRQPFYDYDDLGDVFPIADDHINTRALSRILHEHPSLDESFYTLAGRGLAMAGETALAPDTIRRGNLGITAGTNSRLIIVDGQPVDIADPGATDYILPQLEQLERYLDPAHA